MVPHPGRSKPYGRLLQVLWVSCSRCTIIPGTIRPMTYPAFLDNQQIEELETFGVIELTDDLMEQMFSWLNEPTPTVKNCNEGGIGLPLVW